MKLSEKKSYTKRTPTSNNNKKLIKNKKIKKNFYFLTRF